ncbi:MAG: MGMT family protein [Clostridia bacterium]|nr:MGMT family protein [Clostridia bacterium]MBR5284395.1 MGMT family protein [Clostridia bacterium]
MGFFKNVHKVVSYIPEGRVMSYSDIAEVIDQQGKARFVGFAMKFCPSAYPWHRVVKADGRLTMGDMQMMLLRKENVPFDDFGVDINKCKVYPAEMHLILKEKGEI